MGRATRAGGSAPIRYQGEVRGALTIGTIDPARSFGRHELDSLRRLADMGSMALEQAEMRKHLELAVGSGVEALTEAIDMRDHYTWHHSKNVMELAGKLGQAARPGRGGARRARLRRRACTTSARSASPTRSC